MVEGATPQKAAWALRFTGRISRCMEAGGTEKLVKCHMMGSPEKDSKIGPFFVLRTSVSASGRVGTSFKLGAIDGVIEARRIISPLVDDNISDEAGRLLFTAYANFVTRINGSRQVTLPKAFLEELFPGAWVSGRREAVYLAMDDIGEIKTLEQYFFLITERSIEVEKAIAPHWQVLNAIAGDAADEAVLGSTRKAGMLPDIRAAKVNRDAREAWVKVCERIHDENPEAFAGLELADVNNNTEVARLRLDVPKHQWK